MEAAKIMKINYYVQLTENNDDVVFVMVMIMKEIIRLENLL